MEQNNQTNQQNQQTQGQQPSGENKQQTSGSAEGTGQKQQGGYSSEPEQQEVKKEQEIMHNERDENSLSADEKANPDTKNNTAGGR